MIPYPSIESVWKRDGKYLVHGKVRQPENALVCDWLITEKIDGMNIRLIFSESGMEIRGRTDRAQFKTHWLDFLNSLVDVEQAKDMLRHPSRSDWNVTVYGELYGPGIQKGGTCSDFLQFRAFDLLYGGKIWGSYDQMVSIALHLGLKPVPLVAEGLSFAEIPATAEQMDSLLGTSQGCPKGGRMEGYVAKPRHVLLNASGERVMYKLTYRDVPSGI